MTGVERRKRILDTIQQDGFADISAMAEQCEVSTMTIRRDLARMEAEGLVVLGQGGALARTSLSLAENSMTEKSEQKKAEKEAIAREALKYLKGTCFLDAGTTVLCVCRLIPESFFQTDHTLFTNSLLAAQELSRHPQVSLVAVPGVFREMSMAFLGSLCESFVANFTFPVLFLACEGIDLKAGLSVPDLQDACTKKALCAHSEQIICLADSSKFGRSFLCSFASLAQIALIITDKNLSDELYTLYSQYVRIVRV